MRILALTIVAVLFASCSDDDSTNNANNAGDLGTDVQHDRSTNEDFGRTTDVGGRDLANADASHDVGRDLSRDLGLDAIEILDIGGDTIINDVGTDATVDVGTPDVGSDAGSDTGMSDPYAGRPTGQCTGSADCPVSPNGQQCSATLPGGACLGCGNDTHCPGSTECNFGTCVESCVDDDDCAPGLDCKASGRCGAMRCIGGVCPVPLFGCSSSDFCQRINCSQDATICPQRTTCTNGFCMEDRSL